MLRQFCTCENTNNECLMWIIFAEAIQNNDSIVFFRYVLTISG
jgi:hypothetical protein